ncbi:CST complex subunit CTC1-like [Elysia marginata]|uniref:CST complex subunit CTC1-like n=1 Tax=Elysia marginata TaxID=1093978 RepID=A0AAV4J4W4_9GAST|nr:CST complex subunit CTC1-like [Elysia marginata]
MSDLPKVLLSDLWLLGLSKNTEASQGAKLPTWKQSLFSLECYICMFFQLIIKTVCSLCRELYVDGKCQGKRCRNDGHPKLLVQAVVLIDDGSGQATVTFQNSSLVASLLTLTENQWNDISEGLRNYGPLYITKDGTVPPLPVAQLLSSLCSSSLVLRPCKLAVTRDRKSPCQHLVDQKTLDEFQIKEVRIARNSVNTWSLPLLSLECFALEEIE